LGKPKQVSRRAGRNAARAKAVKSGMACKGDGKNIHHKNNNPKDNRSCNIASVSVSKNRGFPRTSTNKPKGRFHFCYEKNEILILVKKVLTHAAFSDNCLSNCSRCMVLKSSIFRWLGRYPF
jgi:hypothetical protein